MKCLGILSSVALAAAVQAAGLQSGRSFVLLNEHEQMHEQTDLEVVTWLVIQ
jgi:hypothetical protein